MNEVGKSFGIIKFVPKGETEEIDIAIPRTEKKIREGYQGFEVVSDHTLPIETDLYRRDFTINSMAMDVKGTLIDPFNGYEDLKNKIIRLTNPDAFTDDPLRMLRAVQFASRFGFEIETITLELIKLNSEKISEISPERILIEFEKIVSKGDPYVGALLLIKTKLYKAIFKTTAGGLGRIEECKTIGEFLFTLFKARRESLTKGSDIYKNQMHGEIDTFKEIKGYELGTRYFNEKETFPELRMRLFKMYNISSTCFDSKIFDSVILREISLFKKGIFPKTLKELKVDGNDLMELGFQGPEISKAFETILIAIFEGTLKNTKRSIIKFLKK
jgi:tRNA nucleotidyltransferase/poly(A) polymerase